MHPVIADALAVLLEALDATGLAPATHDARGVKAVIARAFRGPSLADDDVVVGAVVVAGAPVSAEAWRTLSACVDGAPLASLAVRIDAAPGNSLVGGALACLVGPQVLPPLEGGPDASVDAFCQTDPELARAVYTRAARFVTERAAADATFVDAYAGAGGFTRALLASAAGAHVIAIERAAEGVRTLRSLPRARVEVIEATVEDALPSLQGRALAGVIVDPPKGGLKDAASPLARLGAQRLVLVACDPDAGARDVKVLVDAGYRIVAVEPYDLFPATPEIEVVLLLER